MRLGNSLARTSKEQLLRFTTTAQRTISKSSFGEAYPLDHSSLLLNISSRFDSERKLAFLEGVMGASILAVQHIRRMRGGSQSHLMRASDGGYYVTKFRNNPQHVRVLANEMFATRLGQHLRLPMPRVELIEVSGWLVENTPELRIQMRGVTEMCSAGRQVASRYVSDATNATVLDYLPEAM